MITTLPEPCWIVEFPNSDIREETHHDCEADAQTEADDRAEEDDEPDRYKVRQKDRACTTASCNGCGKHVDTDDFPVCHFADESEAAYYAGEADFVVAGTDAWCDDCRSLPHEFVADPQVPVSCVRCSESADEHPDVAP